MSKFDMGDYVEVDERIRQFFTKYPEGSLRRKDWEVKDAGGRTFIVYTALAYRTPDDKRPGEGTAWEPFPGTTPYTKNSELQNAETSAWGRALVALGFVGKKIASKNEVRNRQAEKNGTSQPTVAETFAAELLGLAQQLTQAQVWDSEKLKKHLLSHGAKDTSSFKAAIATLSPENGEKLKAEMVEALAAGVPA